MHEALYKVCIFRHGQTLKTYDSVIKNTIDWIASYLRRSGGLKILLKSWICKDKLNGFSLFSACLLKWHTWNSELGRSSRLEPLSFSPTVRKCNTSGTGGQQPTRNLSSDDMGQDLQPHTLTHAHTRSHPRTQRAKPLSWFKRSFMVLFAHSSLFAKSFLNRSYYWNQTQTIK